jgi:hypothetical protein
MFKPGVLILSAMMSLAANMACASGNSFAGKWKLVASESRMPDEMKVQIKGDNAYTFDFGGGVETIVIDGSDQPGIDGSLLSVNAQAPDTWIVKRKTGDRLSINATWKLSSDGGTLKDYFRQFEADGSMTSIDYVYRRTGEGSGFAGEWRSITETVNSPYVLELKEFQSDGLYIIDPVEHRTKSAKLEGQDEPKDSADATSNAGQSRSSSFRHVDERTMVVTDKTNGKVRVTEEFVLSPDLKVLTMTVHAVSLVRPYVLVFRRT